MPGRLAAPGRARYQASMKLIERWLALMAVWTSRRHRARDRLRARWARPGDDRRDDQAAAMLTEVDDGEVTSDRHRVDARTWSDLEMPHVFRAVDRTMTAVGAQRLHQLLATPCHSVDALHRREQLIARFEQDETLRLAVQECLLPLQREPEWGLPRVLWGRLPASPVSLPLLHALSWSLPLAVAGAYWFPALWLVVLALFAVNTILELWLQKIVAVHLATLGYLHRVLATARRLASLRVDGIEDVQRELASGLEGTAALMRRSRWMAVHDPFELVGYVRTAMLRNAITFFRLRELIVERATRLRAVYKAIGMVDAALSIASLRAERAPWCRPELVEGSSELGLGNVRHPALAEPVGNDLDLRSGRSLLITGSNMSGKSTFLRTVGVSAILAQTIHTVFAARYSAPLLRVMTSMNAADNLAAGKSYYLDEIESVLRLVREAGGQPRSLFLVDEMFRGTNPIERVAAASEILRHLAAGGTVLAATHDREICANVSGWFDQAHFAEQVSEHGLAFDYRLRSGPCSSRNAIALLRVSGYPDSIVDAASRRIADADLRRLSRGRRSGAAASRRRWRSGVDRSAPRSPRRPAPGRPR